MKLLLTTENERELAAGLCVEGATDSQLAEVGAWMTDCALAKLDRAGIEWSWAHQQSVGTHAIVQSATDAERTIWDDAIAGARGRAEQMLAAAVIESEKSLAE